MKHAFFGPGKAVPIPAVFRQPFVFSPSVVARLSLPTINGKAKRQAQAEGEGA